MRTFRLSALLALIAFGFVSFATRPTQDAPDPAAMPPDMVEMMRLAQPGPEHAELAKYTGEWEGDVSIYSSMAPDAEPMKQTASATHRMVLGGRFLELVAKGDFMGAPFESITMIGFDRRNEVWTTVGFDTLGTYWVTGTGKRDEAGVIHMLGRDESPQGSQEFIFEVEFVSDDELVSSVYFTKMGPQVFDEPFKMVEVRYTRK